MYRMPNIVKSFFLCLLFLTNTASANNTKIRVVTSFSILEDLVKELGGKHVSVVNLVGRNSDAHTYQPKPSDAVAIAKADLVVFNGLEFEGWISRLIHNSGFKNKQLIASEGVKAMTYSGEIDPHAWQSFHNIRVYIRNITDTFRTLRPALASVFTQRQAAYLLRLGALEKHLIERLTKIPREKRIVVTSHDAFGYLGREYDIQFLAPVGLNIEVEASAKDVAAVINQIREQRVAAIFIENITNPRLLQRIAVETNVAIGGTLYSDALSEENGSASTYLHMMKHNIESLIAAFGRT
ncbi:MAG: zinc/manganese transport system substrate-binding protein [Lentisphaeria bacterium]|jgi:zinc/manganese transport system substrate-binding protein